MSGGSDNVFRAAGQPCVPPPLGRAGRLVPRCERRLVRAHVGGVRRHRQRARPLRLHRRRDGRVHLLRAEADLTRINGVTSLLQDGPVLLAPVLGAALSAAVAPSAVFVVAAVTSLGCVAALLVVRWDAPPDRRVANPFRGARDGIRWILRHPGLRRLELGFGTLNLANGIGASATTAYVLLLGERGIGSGASLAAFSIAGSAGLLAGTALVAARGDRILRLDAIAGAAVVLGLVGRVVIIAGGLGEALVGVAMLRSRGICSLLTSPATRRSGDSELGFDRLRVQQLGDA